MGRRLLFVAGLLSSAIAVFHIVVIFIGAPAYRYFGAGEEIARKAEQGSLFPALLTFGIAIVFAMFALYAFSGAGVVRRLPLLRTALVAIGIVFVLRGIEIVPELIQLSQQGRPLLHRAVVFSAVSLIVGVIYLLGVAMNWRAIAARS